MSPLHISQGLIFANVCEKTSSKRFAGIEFHEFVTSKNVFALHLLVVFVQDSLKSSHYLDFSEEFLYYWCDNYIFENKFSRGLIF